MTADRTRSRYWFLAVLLVAAAAAAGVAALAKAGDADPGTQEPGAGPEYTSDEGMVSSTNPETGEINMVFIAGDKGFPESVDTPKEAEEYVLGSSPDGEHSRPGIGLVDGGD